MRSAFVWPLAIASALAGPIQERQAAGPSVTVTNGTIVGSSTLGVDSFRGIPFAAPPVGPLRLKAPQSYNQKYPGGVLAATAVPTACPQFNGTPLNTTAIPLAALELLGGTAAVTVMGEDCLTLNVQRPVNTTASSKLPVVFWIFGGGFETGSTQSYDATQFLSNGIASGHPVIYVAVNYRLNAFGFLAGKEVQADGSTNLGLRDQRLGLEWVAENIAAFGGDPTKVTIWGESAGSISVFDQTIINGGDNTYKGKPLFRGAIMDSGSIVPAEPVNTGKAQNIYNAVVKAAGCSGSSNTLACLRTVPFATFQAAANSVPGLFSYRSLDLSYSPRPDPTSKFFSVSPDVAVTKGAYAKVPIIIGDQEDEGTLFSLSQSNITNTAQLITYLQSYFPVEGASLVPGLVATYPDDPAAGSPFRTGALNEVYPEFKRLAAILGDITFTLTRREYLTRVVSSLPGAWSYLDSHLYGLGVVGTFHESDVLEAYASVPDAVPGLTYQSYYTSFINYLNPNTISTAAPLINWPKYTTANPQLLNLNAANNTLIPDTFRSASYQYLNAHYGQIKS